MLRSQSSSQKTSGIRLPTCPTKSRPPTDARSIFHGISRAEGPFKQTRRSLGLKGTKSGERRVCPRVLRVLCLVGQHLAQHLDQLRREKGLLQKPHLPPIHRRRVVHFA